ncbi:glycosyltransferase family 4 protein [Sulfitobacter sabulilitoris]|uniref:Glycosyltransferase family 4 protein n=1 Tax=Sulfitobacter sabulilitoris TaxID=2562655 RepID=A0A5S3PDH2_9RHOB|nr:glycosyltransferase family 4 protein [Sulfitobacter sabulilitoris]TMM49536.1 glycosyltransferase family 4 protein [Sulfitobacter sabulilitoris]
MKFAFLVTPHVGGTFTVYSSLRAELRAHDIELRWMGPADERALLADARWADEMKSGEAIGSSGADPGEAQAREMAARLDAGGYDGVFVNVLSDQASTNLIRHIPARYLRIMIVHNITPGTYAAASAIRDHVHAIVCVCDRARDDLCRRRGFAPDRISVIRNAVTMPKLSVDTPARGTATGLRTLFLGRIEDASKGVLLLPAILKRVHDDVTLTVAGDGPDSKRLKIALSVLEHRAAMIGATPQTEVPTLLARHDALIMPSRFEGMPMALIEAMAMGCIPVASWIDGVTNTIVENERNGLLFPVGNATAAAEALDALRADPAWRAELSAAARATAADHFGGARMGQEYGKLIHALKLHRPPIAPPVSFAEWRLPRGLHPGLRTYLPRPVKNALRVAQERLKLRFRAEGRLQ